MLFCRGETWSRIAQRVAQGGRSWRVEQGPQHRSWAEIGGADVRDAREGAVDCGGDGGVPAMFVGVREGSETPWEQHQETDGVAR